MCFSASASFVAGGTISLLGVATLGKARSASDVPLASIPLLFAVQQLVEGIVWLSFREHGVGDWNGIATMSYSLFSHVLWPAFVPLAVLAYEPDRARKRLLAPLVLLGALVSLYLLYFIVFDPVRSEVVHHSIQYTYHHHYPRLTMVLYLIAVCASCLGSSHSFVRVFGTALGVAFALAYLAYPFTFFSVWCFFGAALSLVLYLHFRNRQVSQYAPTARHG